MYKELLKEFCINKNEILKRITGINIYEKEDYEEMDTWTEEECIDICLDPFWRIYDSDYYCCPWCIKLGGKCELCGYGKRNGVCIKSPNKSEVFSKYEVIISSILDYFKDKGHIDSISGIPEIQTLIEKFLDKINELEQEKYDY